MMFHIFLFFKLFKSTGVDSGNTWTNGMCWCSMYSRLRVVFSVFFCHEFLKGASVNTWRTWSRCWSDRRWCGGDSWLRVMFSVFLFHEFLKGTIVDTWCTWTRSGRSWCSMMDNSMSYWMRCNWYLMMNNMMELILFFLPLFETHSFPSICIWYLRSLILLVFMMSLLRNWFMHFRRSQMMMLFLIHLPFLET